MITLTDVAADRLQDLLKEQATSDLGLRVFVQGGGCAGLQYGMVYEGVCGSLQRPVSEGCQH